MTKVTILGAGITGLVIAASLPKHYDITVIARNLPGDPDSQEWASPWAGAVWLGMLNSSDADQKIQLKSLALWRNLAERHPESSVRRLQLIDVIDEIPPEEIWYRNKVPGFRPLQKEELPGNAPHGATFGSMVVTPMHFLPWLRKRLEETGVKFMRTTVASLDELKGLGHHILINASGTGPKYLTDIKDDKVLEVRGQTVLVKSPYNKCFMRRGKDYTYHIPRGDGTAILGGIKEYGSTAKEVSEATRNDIFRRIHENLPDVFPSADPKAFQVVRDIVGIRPQRDGGVRIEKEVLNGQRVVHAYGVEAGGYLFSWGLGLEVAELVNDFELEPTDSPVLSKL
ncbi:Nucleotide-binding domain-containing protein [Pleurostoma richardsiae]|uniref:Nucleotide-binding domain-containing protein n=1 Tax=Pleurostoma richardsiae TaxID=41990 RepID=A0AA38VLC3_9PEZI|nr:Nucleotide-binding domain-containing protein [Pleurostoma richardsiae]